MKNKNLIIIGILIIVLLIGGGAYFLNMNKSQTPVQQATQSTTNTSATNNTGNSENKLEMVEGSLNSLLTGGKTQKCTYSINTDNATITGQVYTANGKVRQEFQSTSTAGPINGHMIVDNKVAYMWTDQMPQGLKFSIENQPSPAVQSNNQAPDFNKAMKFDCLPWSVDNTQFDLPTNITFQSMSVPKVPPAGNTGGNTSNSTDMSSQCAVCSNVPEGPAREACKSQLKCP